VLAWPEPRRLRDKTHIRFVSKQPCLVCSRRPADAHHIRFSQHTALARKVSDEFTVPLCRVHHRELHRSGNEVDWWQKVGIDPLGVASALWGQTRPLRAPFQPASPAPPRSERNDQISEAAMGASEAVRLPPPRRSTRNRKTNPIESTSQ